MSHKDITLIAGTYPQSHCCLLFEEVQSLLVGLPLLMALPMCLQFHRLVLMAAEEVKPVLEWSSDQDPTPVRLEMHYQRLIRLH